MANFGENLLYGRFVWASSSGATLEGELRR